MYLKQIEAKNFRLLHDVQLLLENRTTVIVGRNNSGKTSLTEVMKRLLSDATPSFSLEDFSFAATRLHRRRAGTHRRRACGRRAACRPAGPAAAILAALPPPRTGRAVPVERDQPGIVRQPVFRPGQRIRRDRRRASGLAGDTPMMAANSLRSGVPSGMSFYCSSPCRRACRAGAFAPHVALPSAKPSNVQASCLERARPAAFIASVRAFAGALAAPAAAAPPGRRCLERQRKAKAEGKIEGCGTRVRAKPVCTWGWRGTRLMAASCRDSSQCLAAIGESACLARQGATGLPGATP